MYARLLLLHIVFKIYTNKDSSRLSLCTACSQRDMTWGWISISMIYPQC